MKDLEFGDVIGRGSFAIVYRGRWQGKDVALKQIRVPCGNIATVPKEVAILRWALMLYMPDCACTMSCIQSYNLGS